MAASGEKTFGNFDFHIEIVFNFLCHFSHFPKNNPTSHFLCPFQLLRLKFQLPSFSEKVSNTPSSFKIGFQFTFYQIWLPNSNFFQIRLPTSNFFQNRLLTSNFLPNRLPTSNFSTIIEGGTVPPSIAYYCSPGLVEFLVFNSIYKKKKFV